MKSSTGIPLQEPTFFILLSLAMEQKHGYAIIKEVAELSGGKIRLSTGTLYGALGRLLDQGYIVQLDQPGPSEEKLYPGKPRKTYQLTRLGRQVVACEVQRLTSLVETARTRLGESQALLIQPGRDPA